MEQIESKIEELKRRAEQRETIRYPKDFKEDAVEAVDRLRKEGWTQTAVSEALGIPWVTLKRWRGDGEDSSKEKATKGFRPVEVVDGAGTHRAALVSPSGWRIEGLSLAELIEVARRLS